MTTQPVKRRTSKRKRTTQIVIGLILLIVTIRLILPYVVLHFANKSLANMSGYYGHIEDVDLAIIRGAYRVDSIYLNKADTITGKQTPFFASSAIDLALEWKALFKGEIVGQVFLQQPYLRFTKDKVEPKEIVKDSADFRKVLDKFMPLSINHFEINGGVIEYKDFTSKPVVDISMTQLHLIARNLRNSYDSTALLPATVNATANIYEGTLRMDARLNPLADNPTFDMSAELKNTNLVKLNDFFQAYAKIDVNDGRFGLYTEVAAKNNAFTGYVKPVIQNLDILGKEDRKDNLFQKMWEAVAGGVGEIFENQRKDQVATKIPFKGKLDDPKTNVWVTIATILQNAFISALQPSIDNEISIGSVESPGTEKKTFLQKVFGKDDKPENSTKEVKKEEKKEARKEERKEKKEERKEKRANKKD
ncbi:hypothetical protein DYBT9623_04118 [Dyadobacter sp. CECT 9623]|uniref:DUF748 domain-containing protein n=1 Tax=Dyadobacter linearis TaxID=2823330 RepID=A0ABM8UUW5_9BACT|nr:DUF748 domain-containing protein [Dyadobacter sp. CECT 9623]CAG5072332.1 hypothetical protein DYBT9623_04118 [Dyadobacter sp. CECT 9623]